MHKASHSHTCPYCDYNIAGIDIQSQCPECGNRLDPDFLVTIMSHPKLDARLLMWRCAALGWLIAALVLLVSGRVAQGASHASLFVICLAMGFCCCVAVRRTKRIWPKVYMKNPGTPDTPLGHSIAFVAMAVVWVPLIFAFMIGVSIALYWLWY